MAKSRRSPPAVQDCTGQDGGHLCPPPGVLVARTPDFRGPVPGFTGVELVTMAALTGNRCVGVLTRLEDNDGRPLPPLHAADIVVRPNPALSAAPDLALTVTRAGNGRLLPQWAGVPDGLPPHVLDHLRDAWRWVERHRLGGRPGGRAPSATPTNSRQSWWTPSGRCESHAGG